MSSSTDSRIVTMKFDNAQFERGVSQTTQSLDKLNQSLQMKGAAQGLHGVQDAASKINLSAVEGGITRISSAFVAMSTVAITALSNITNRAVDAGIQLAKSLTIDPIKAGFDEYELKLGSIQTILANTQRYGTTLPEVTAALDDLNHYADKTIYNFGDMTKNIGLFTNAGIKIEDATSMIKGFSNSAAASGTSAEGAAGAAYQLSQALSAGTIRLMDWRSLTNVGMGNKNMQEGIIGIAEAMGTFEKSGSRALDATNDFNGSLETGWLSADVMSTYLKIMAGDMDEAQMKAIGLSDSMIATFKTQQQTAEDAATKVRTFTQLLGTLREAVGSGWSQTFETVIGNFDEATELWTKVSGAIGGFIQSSSDARNKVLADWKELHGREFLIAGLKNIFEGLMSVIKPIRDAFRELFPPKTGEELMRFTASFAQFTNKLRLSDESMDRLKRTFKGVFAAFSILGQVIGGVVSVLGDMLGALSGSGGGILEITGGMGDMIVRLNDFLKEGDRLKHFFDDVGRVLKVPIQLLSIILGFIGDLFSYFRMDETEKATSAFEEMGEALTPIDLLVRRISDSFAKLGAVLKKIIDNIIKPLAGKVGDALSEVWEKIKGAFTSGNFNALLDIVNVGLFGGLLYIVKGGFRKFTDMIAGFLSKGVAGNFGSTGILGSIKETFGQLTETLKTMQTEIKSDILIKIAIAVGILTVSIVALSLIDSAKLTKALVALGVAFGELLGAMAILEKISSSTGYKKMPFVAAALILFSTAILILTAAVKNLSELDWDELAKGLLGLSGLLFIINKAVEPLSNNAGDMIRASAGILILSVALRVLANVVKAFGEMDWGTIGRGLLAMAGALAVIAQTMYMMPKNMIVTAAGLIVVGVALGFIAAALGKMGSMSWEEVGKGLLTLAGSLTILAVALYAMSGTIMGAAALLVAAVALKLLTSVLKTLGSMPIEDIAKGLLALVALFVLLGVGAYLLTPVIPVLLLLGVAVGLIAASMLMAGIGVLAFVTAIMILVALGAAAGAAIGLLLKAIIDKIPALFEALAQGIVRFAETIANSGSAFADAATKLITSMAEGIIRSAPKVGEAISVVITTLCETIIKAVPQLAAAYTVIILTFLDTITTLIPEVVQTGVNILLSVMRGIGKSIHHVVTAATNIITEFIRAIGNNAPKVANEGAKTIIKFINGLSAAIDQHSEELGRAGGRLAASIIKGMVKGLIGGAGEVVKGVKDLATDALNAAKSALGINSPSKEFLEVGKSVSEGFATGIHNNANIVNQSVISMGDGALDAMKTTMEKLSDLVAKEVSLDPTITPTLDLSQVQQGASKLKSLIQTDTLAPTVSYAQAASISESQNAGDTIVSEQTAQPATQITFEQNNYSPKALSSVEIYRQTKNQLSLAKEALNV